MVFMSMNIHVPNSSGPDLGDRARLATLLCHGVSVRGRIARLKWSITWICLLNDRRKAVECELPLDYNALLCKLFFRG